MRTDQVERQANPQPSYPRPERWAAFKRYNARDVEAEMSIQQRLRKFPVPGFVWDEYQASHKCPEHQKEHMREVMRDKWTPERRAAMSEKMKQLRRERNWHSTGE